jgi:hypothetical protein
MLGRRMRRSLLGLVFAAATFLSSTPAMAQAQSSEGAREPEQVRSGPVYPPPELQLEIDALRRRRDGIQLVPPLILTGLGLVGVVATISIASGQRWGQPYAWSTAAIPIGAGAFLGVGLGWLFADLFLRARLDWQIKSLHAPPPLPAPALVWAPEMRKDWYALPKPGWPLIAAGGTVVVGVAISTGYALKIGAGSTSFNTDQAIMIVSGTVAGVAFVGGVLYYIFGPGKPYRQVMVWKPVVAPWLGKDSGGLALSLRF